MKGRVESIVHKAKTLQAQSANEATWRDDLEQAVLQNLRLEIIW